MATSSSDAQKIYEVDEVKMSSYNPPAIKVTAKGKTRTGGWTNPQLSRRVYVQPPADGVQEFDFVANPPTGGSTTALTPVEASDTMTEPPTWLRGVRVYAETNCKEELIEEKARQRE